MFHPHQRITPTIAVTMALAACAATPAVARVNLNPLPAASQQTQSSTGPCSEVCSGGAASYGVATPVSTGPCSEVCSGGAASYGLATSAPVNQDTGAALPHNPRGHADAALSNVAQSAPVRVVNSGSGFDWGDAAIGAGGTIVLLLLIGGGAYASVTRRSRHLGGESVSAAG